MNELVKKFSGWQLCWYFLCLVLALGQLQKLMITDNVGIYVHDSIVFLWGLVALFYPKSRKATVDFIIALPLWAKVLGSWILVSFLMNSALFGLQVVPFLYLGRLVTYGLFLLQLRYLVRAKLLSRQDIFKGVLLCVGFIAWFGMLQYGLIPDTRVLLFLGWDDHYYRLISTLLDPGFTGLVLVIGWWLAVRGAKLTGKLQILAGGVLLIPLLLTYSRASYLAWAVSVGVLSLQSGLNRNWKQALLWAGLIPTLAMCIFLLPKTAGEGTRLERTSTIEARQLNITQTLASLTPQTLLIGQGLFRQNLETASEFTDHSRVPDNWLVLLLQASGVLGLGIFVVGLGWVLRQAWNTKNSPLLYILVAVLVHGLFSASLIYPWVILLVGAIAAAEFTQQK